MTKSSSRSQKFSPLLWVAPLPFVLAMCLPLDLPTMRAAPQRVAAAMPSDDATTASDAPGAEPVSAPANTPRRDR